MTAVARNQHKRDGEEKATPKGGHKVDATHLRFPSPLKASYCSHT